MGKISSYINASSPISGADKLIGTDSANNNETKNFTVQEIADFVGLGPYKVYTALLTQNGGDNSDGQISGTLVIGRTYRITDEGGDFTNVGAPNNNFDTYFVATGTTPNNWGTGSLTFNTGAPVVTVLENTIGNVWWSYHNQGIYKADCTGGFTIDKTVFFSNPSAYYADNVIETDVTSTSVYLNSYGLTNSAYENDLLYKTPIEIRVYN